MHLLLTVLVIIDMNNFQWMAFGNIYSKAGSRWWLFQIATGFADIPWIVRIFPELCQYWGELFRARPILLSPDSAKFNTIFLGVAFGGQSWNFQNFNEFRIQTWFDKKNAESKSKPKICAQHITIFQNTKKKCSVTKSQTPQILILQEMCGLPTKVCPQVFSPWSAATNCHDIFKKYSSPT